MSDNKKKIFGEAARKIIEENEFDLDLTFDVNGDLEFKLVGTNKPLGQKCAHIAKDMQDLVGGVDDKEVPTNEFFQKPQEVPEALLLPSQIKSSNISRPKVVGFESNVPTPEKNKEKKKDKSKGRQRLQDFE